MAKPEFVYVSYIATTPEKLWAALTDKKFTRTYWYDRRLESDWSIGSPVRFYDGGSDKLTDSGVVLAYDPYTHLSYTFHNEFSEGAIAPGTSRVSFTIEDHKEMVKLTLIHDDLPDEETANGFREGWAPILSSLKSLLETGKPLPQLKFFEDQGQVGSGNGERSA